MASLTDIREGLAANLAVIPDLNASPFILGNPTPPCAEIEPGPTEFDLAFDRGLDRWTFTVRVMVALSTDQGAQRLLDQMLASSGTLSVKAALESDKTLAGACADLRVTGTSGYKAFPREGGGPLLGVEFAVEVLGIG